MNSSPLDFQRNNLFKAFSPYLRQHADNPVWWQEFSDEVIAFAEGENKPILLSGGYSSCHWCHVMAADAFSHQPTADFLNEHFVCIKIDRETRPDIDIWMMAYLQETTGQGGWPLNVFAAPDLKPFFSVMYAPSSEGSHGRPSLRRILEHVLRIFQTQRNLFSDWKMNEGHSAYQNIEATEDSMLTKQMYEYFDFENGGVYGRQKFPPHTALHFLLTIEHDNQEIDDFVRFTLLKMVMSGLHDHLQGGFFRYCVDTEWTIPHFEKMLYDQAMMLMNFSLAAHRFHSDKYSEIVKSIIVCLEETFLIDGLYASAHDADTEHEEGMTYLWTEQELAEVLNSYELSQFMETYILQNFEGRYHLLKRNGDAPGNIERRLLAKRKERIQPFCDEKIITSWNAWTGIALVFADRYAGAGTLSKAKQLFEDLMNRHSLDNGLIAHSSLNNQVQPFSFLDDMATMLLFSTYLFEHLAVDVGVMEKLHLGLMKFRHSGVWYESMDTQFGNIPASMYDHPVPSSVSTAEAALARFALLTGNVPESLHFKSPLTYDYFNLAVKWGRRDFPVIAGPDVPDFSKLPAGILFHFAPELTVCRDLHCVSTSEDDLYKMLSGSSGNPKK